LKNNFNGFRNNGFYKCFSVEGNARDGTTPLMLELTFNATLEPVLKRYFVFAGFNYPQQFSRANNLKAIWPYPEEGISPEEFEILSIKTVMQRNKRNEPCFLDWMSYDTLLLKKHLENVGCRAPYHKTYDTFPICNTVEQMKKSYLDMWSLPLDYQLMPCQYMTTVPYRHSKELSFKPNSFTIIVTYPSNVKTVKQSQAVDVHALIGNIGGYIGLFMGNSCLVYYNK
jgi:hypothetical protein